MQAYRDSTSYEERATAREERIPPGKASDERRSTSDERGSAETAVALLTNAGRKNPRLSIHALINQIDYRYSKLCCWFFFSLFSMTIEAYENWVLCA